MTIWVDADSCPRPVRELIIRAAIRLGLPAVFVADRPLADVAGPGIAFRLCPTGADSADDLIVEAAGPGDLAVTRDLPLASRLVDKGVSVVNDRGSEYSAANIRERVSMRDFVVGMAEAGYLVERSGSYGPKERKAFADAFDRTLQRLLRAAGRISPSLPDTSTGSS
jgi:uncharacterized protein YaiI (UPF0178 family)